MAPTRYTPALGIAQARLIVVERDIAALQAERRDLLILLGREDVVVQGELDWVRRLAPHTDRVPGTKEEPLITWLVDCPGIHDPTLTKKIDCIKAVRAATGLTMGLREAKEGVESCSTSRPFLIGACRDRDLRALLELGAVLRHPGSTVTGEST